MISSAIEDIYLTKQRRSPTEVIQEVMKRCKVAKIVPPHENTIRKRIADVRPATALRRRGQKDKARDAFDPILGAFPERISSGRCAN